MMKKAIEFIKKYWKIILGIIVSAITFLSGSFFIFMSLSKYKLKKDDYEYQRALDKLKAESKANENKINNSSYNDFNDNGTIKPKRPDKNGKF